jgi:TIR domain
MSTNEPILIGMIALTLTVIVVVFFAGSYWILKRMNSRREGQENRLDGPEPFSVHVETPPISVISSMVETPAPKNHAAPPSLGGPAPAKLPAIPTNEDAPGGVPSAPIPTMPVTISIPSSTTMASTQSPLVGPAVRSVFVSYRRQDSQHITGRIYDRLAARFGREAIFKDVDSIPLGFDFRDHLREQVGQCAVLIAVIGKNWNPPAASGGRRLGDPRDHLRIEIESALDRRIPVIPVLVDGIDMPTEEELPHSLARLAYHNGIAVRPDPDFHHDADRLVRGIEALFKQTPR